MDQHKVQSLSRVYAPNEYAVWLSPDDRKQFEGTEDELASELSGYLLEHAPASGSRSARARASCSRPTRSCGSASSASRRGGGRAPRAGTGRPPPPPRGRRGGTPR